MTEPDGGERAVVPVRQVGSERRGGCGVEVVEPPGTAAAPTHVVGHAEHMLVAFRPVCNDSPTQRRLASNDTRPASEPTQRGGATDGLLNLDADRVVVAGVRRQAVVLDPRRLDPVRRDRMRKNVVDSLPGELCRKRPLRLGGFRVR